jgi:DNA repair protein RecN (Recombination protein N)
VLQELEIRDFALIERVRVAFGAGFNALTGETGAGKSIIIDALNVVLGGKVSPSAIRNGAERARVEATFALTAEIGAWLKLNELCQEDFEGLSLSREVTKSGSKCRINGTLVNISLVQDLRSKLLTMHAQHESRTLMTPQAQLDLLDGLADDAHRKLLSKVRTLHARFRQLENQLAELTLSEDERSRRLDFARFQLHELSEAHLQSPDEDANIQAQCKLLANAVDLEHLVARAQAAISGAAEDDTAHGALDLLQLCLSEVSKAAEFDEALLPVVEQLGGCVDTVTEGQRQLRRYRERIDCDPVRLSELQARAAQLAVIKRKYGPSLVEAIARQSDLSAEIERLSHARDAIAELTDELAAAQEELMDCAGNLSQKRQTLARKVGKRILSELVALGMSKCDFQVAVTPAAGLAAHGSDKVELLIAPNPGQPLAPLAKIASGGELSRVMLAVKSVFAQADSVATVIFDEIDTGMSGKVLQTMRDKLAQLAGSHQILCITHQPIIAAVADRHIEVRKRQTSTTTSIQAVILEGEEKVRAVAAMAGGDNSLTSMEFARALFDDVYRLKA